jgi:hypothetical protein
MTYDKSIKQKEKKKMEDSKELRTCASDHCAHGTHPQPIENFDVNHTSQQPFRLCRTCRAKQTDDIHELFVQGVCDEFGITVDELRGKTTKEITGVRVEILKRFEGRGLTYEKMGELIGSSSKMVGYLLIRARAESQESPDDTDNNNSIEPDDIVTEKFKAASEVEVAGELVANTEACLKNLGLPSNKYLLELDFKDHIDVYDDLTELASKQERTPPGMVLFVLRKMFEQGLLINDTISLGN